MATQVEKEFTGCLKSVAKTIYQTYSASSLRFQGVLTTGGVDADPGHYWVGGSVALRSMRRVRASS